MNKLIELLKVEASEIETAFKKASIEGEGTPQEVSDRREEIVKRFLSKYFPFPYRIVKGNIIDSFGGRSNSIDCIILNPSHPYTIDPSNDKASIIMADGVDFAIEIKPDLASQTEIERGLKQVQSVKKLRRKRHGLITERNEEKIEYAKQVPCFIFSDKTYVDIRTLISHIVDYYVNNNVPKQEQFDLIIINNRAVIYNFKKYSYIANGEFEGIGYVETGDSTFATFLLHMNSMPHSTPEMGPNIMQLYLKEEISINRITHYADLNSKLSKIASNNERSAES